MEQTSSWYYEDLSAEQEFRFVKSSLYLYQGVVAVVAVQLVGQSAVVDAVVLLAVAVVAAAVVLLAAVVQASADDLSAEEYR